MSYSLDFTTHADVINTELRFQQGATASGGLTEPTSWNPAITYGKNLVVKYGGKYWVSIQSLNLNNTPMAGSAWWDSFVNSGGPTDTGMVWKGQWNGATTYSTGDVVYEKFSSAGGDGMAYISLGDGNTGNAPHASPLDWSPLSEGALSVQPPASNSGLWVSGNRYLPNSVVRYLANETGEGASYFLCVADTLGFETIPPATNIASTTYWKALDSSTFLGAWAGGSAYNKDNEVSVGGGYYRSLVDTNVGNAPLTSTSNWSALGYKGFRLPFNATTALTAGSLGANTPANLKTITSANLAGGTYNYATGYGYLYISSATYGAGVVFTLYLSESSGGAVPANNTANTSYILTPTIVAGSVAGTWFDLSRLTYHNPNGFTNLFLVINSSVGGANITIVPVGATHANNSGTSPTAPANITISTTATSGVAGLTLWKEPVLAI